MRGLITPKECTRGGAVAVKGAKSTASDRGVVAATWYETQMSWDRGLLRDGILGDWWTAWDGDGVSNC